MHRLLLLTPLAALSGCFLAIDLSGEDVDAHFDDDTVATDTAVPVDATLDPAEVTVGTTAIVTATLRGLHAGDVTAVDLGDDVTVTTWRALDDATLALSLDVAADAPPGAVDLVLDRADADPVTVPAALTLVAAEAP